MSTKHDHKEEITNLRKLIRPGQTVYTKLNHVSRSGMYRVIDVYVMHKNEPRRISWSVANVTSHGYDRKHEGVRASGCGMDMGFEVVYNLSHALYGHGYKCKGKGKCPSSYHTNHHDTIRCPGQQGATRWLHCYRGELHGTQWISIEGQEPLEIETTPYVVSDDAGIETVCMVCKGEGYVLNPEGPERFDLLHKDGYALRHRWL